MKTKMPPKGTGRSDIFQTKDPEIALPPILKYVGKEHKIWSPSAGKGRMVDYMRGQGYQVIGTDILTGFDFIDPMAPVPDYDFIIENPPYSIKDKYLQRCYDLGKPFALLMPITALGEQARVAMYAKYGIQILLPSERTLFITPNGTEGGGWFFAAWFCWKFLPEQICFAKK